MDTLDETAASDVEADLQTVLDCLASGRPLDPETARRVRLRSERATQEVLENRGLLNAAVDLVRDVGDGA